MRETGEKREKWNEKNEFFLKNSTNLMVVNSLCTITHIPITEFLWKKDIFKNIIQIVSKFQTLL
jgi:hypothetical protein